MEQLPPTPPSSSSGGAGLSSNAPTLAEIRAMIAEVLVQTRGEAHSLIERNRIEMEDLITQKLQDKNKDKVVLVEKETAIDDPENISNTKEIEFKAFRTCGATEFKGTTDPIEAYEWLSHIEEIFDVSKCIPSDFVRYAVALLRGPARDWWRNEKQAMNKDKLKKLNWDRFKELFFKEYCPEDVQWQYSRDFLNLKQGDMSVSDYRTEFRKKAIFGEAYLRTEKERVKLFVEGLRLDIREDLEGKDIPTFEKAAELARTREKFLVLKYVESSSPSVKRIRSESSPSHVDRSPVSNRSFSKSSRSLSVARHCNRCNRRHAGQCNQDRSGGVSIYQTTSPTSRTCYRCGKEGHIRSNCPEGTVADLTCFECNERGHTRRFCPKMRVTRSTGANAQPPTTNPQNSEQDVPKITDVFSG